MLATSNFYFYYKDLVINQLRDKPNLFNLRALPVLVELVIDQISNEYRVTDTFFIITNLKKMEEEFDIVFISWISDSDRF